MFAYDGRSLPILNNYAEALRFYEQAKTWRNGSDNERKLDGSKRHTTIRKESNGSIACKLHHTDVITYHPDNTITVKPWGSRSTDEFFNALTRGIYGLSSSFTSGVIQVGERFYRAIDTLKIDISSRPLAMLSEPEPFRFATINRKRAKEVRDHYRYNDFAAYARMMEKMGVKPTPYGERVKTQRPELVTAALPNREYWPHLLVPVGRVAFTRDNTTISAALTLADVRNAIYTVHKEVYDRTEEPYLNSWDEVARWKRQ